jgi:hypothetical protein
MTARPLNSCPACRRALDADTRKRMGLRNGELLNSLCPGRIGPSDIDHVLHNGRSNPERVVFYEYKDGAPMPQGQDWLLKSLTGDWEERASTRRISVRRLVLPQHPRTTDTALDALTLSVSWLWSPDDEP